MNSGEQAYVPTVPVQGQKWFNRTTNTVMIFDNGTWRPYHWVFDAAAELEPLVERLPETGTSVGRTHALSMLRRLGRQELSVTQANRWLGWLQCLLVVNNISSLSEMMEHNREFKTDLAEDITATGDDKSFQTRVGEWLVLCFGQDIANDLTERCDRFLEENLELLQAAGYDPKRVPQLVNYVWNRPVGEKHQEVGGVMVTLAALCRALDVQMETAGEEELSRIWTVVGEIREKQKRKRGIATPLPVADQSESQ